MGAAGAEDRRVVLVRGQCECRQRTRDRLVRRARRTRLRRRALRRGGGELPRGGSEHQPERRGRDRRPLHHHRGEPHGGRGTPGSGRTAPPPRPPRRPEAPRPPAPPAPVLGFGRGASLLGFAPGGNVMGRDQPIPFRGAIGPDDRLKDVDILVYREPYGGEVAYEPWRRQFRGARATDSLRVGKEIRSISGATISVHAVTLGVRRLLADLTAWHASGAIR